MTIENAERLGEIIDSLDKLTTIQALSVPDDIHFKAVRYSLSGLVTQLKAIYSSETGLNAWPKFLTQLTPIELDELSSTYIGDGNRFDDFKAFWGNFLSSDPDPEEVTNLLHQLVEWGYVLDRDSAILF